MGVGITAALTGPAGVAHADDNTSASSSATSGASQSSKSESSEKSDSKVADRSDESSSAATENDASETADDEAETDDDLDEQANDDDVTPTEDSAGDADPDEPSDVVLDEDDDEHTGGSSSESAEQPSPSLSTDTIDDDEEIEEISEDDAGSVLPAPTPGAPISADGKSLPDESERDAADSADTPTSETSQTIAARSTALSSETMQTSVADTGIETLAADVPAPPAAPTSLAELLTAFFVRLQTYFFNQTPQARPRQHAGQSSEGEVSGTVGASDPDGDPLEVTVSSGPTKGQLTLNADGTFTYKPSAALASTGGTDSFVVRVAETNAGEHFHGMKGLIASMVRSMTFGAVALDDGSSIEQVVTVTIGRLGGGGTDPGSGGEPNKYDAGLTDPFVRPDAVSGKTINVRDYGATSDDSRNDDAVAIRAAIEAAQAGDMVYMPDGVYHVKSTIKLKSGVSLYGQSRAGTIIAASFASAPHAVIYAAPGANNFTVSSFSIVKASGSSFKAGVRLGGEGNVQVSRIVVENLLIEDFQRFGIQLQNAYQVLVDGNEIRNATALDGGGSGYGIIIDQSKSNNNWIKGNVIGPVIRHGILVQFSAHHNLIEHNTVTGAVSGAIDLHGEDEYSNEIRYNTVSDCVRNGTSVSPNGAGIEIGEYSGIIGTTLMHDNSGPHNWIHHNVVYNCTCGLRIVNNSNYTYIEDNVFYNNLDSGIKADLAPLKHLYILRNEIYGNGSGIKLSDVVNAVLQGNSITDNRNYGIWTNGGVTDYTFSDNTLSDNAIDMILGSLNGTIL